MEKMYTIKQASEILGLKVRTVREYIHTGKLKAYKYAGGRTWHIKASDMAEMMEKANADKCE